MKEYKEEPKYTCKWCGNDEAFSHTKECHGCWELRSRIEYEMDRKTGVVEKIMRFLRKEQ